MKVEITAHHSTICIHAHAEHRQHLNDLLFDAGFDYTNRPGNWIDIEFANTDSVEKLNKVIRWLQHTNAGIRN